MTDAVVTAAAAAATAAVDNMNGLELSRTYFLEVCEPRFKEQFPDLYPHLAAGLVGNGSECFGFDDMTSRDHDWGVDFFIWLPERFRDRFAEVASWKQSVFTFSPPEFGRDRSQYGARIDVMSCTDFYKQLVGVTAPPTDLIPWLRMPEDNLAMCVNGDVFIDNEGEFTSIREAFLRFYPEDIRLKKICAKCMAIAQTGQYNHMRIANRGDIVTVRNVLSRFNDAVMGLVFLLNKVYKPYYKWTFRMMSTLPVLGSEISELLIKLAYTNGLSADVLETQQQYISKICVLLADELRRQGLSDESDWFFTAHGESVRTRIKDNFIRSLPTQYE